MLKKLETFLEDAVDALRDYKLMQTALRDKVGAKLAEDLRDQGKELLRELQAYMEGDGRVVCSNTLTTNPEAQKLDQVTKEAQDRLGARAADVATSEGHKVGDRAWYDRVRELLP